MGVVTTTIAATALALSAASSVLAQTGASAPVERIDSLKRIRATGVIAIGVREASVPFSFLDAKRQPQGYTVDLCLRVADAIKSELRLPRLEVRYVPVTSANRIPMVKDGRVDLECGSTTNTLDRQRDVAFAYTTFVAGIKMLAKKSARLNAIEDLRGRKVVVTTGTTSEKLIAVLNEERVLELDVIRAKDHNESFRMVEEGRAVAFPMDDVLLYGLISRSSNPADFAVVGKYLSVEPYAIMFRREDPDLERIVNRTLNELFQSGEIRRYYAKWFTTRELTVPMSQYLKETFSVPNTHPAWP